MGWPRMLPGRHNPPSREKGNKTCPKCGRRFSHYSIKKRKDGSLVKVCPYCGCQITLKNTSPDPPKSLKGGLGV